MSHTDRQHARQAPVSAFNQRACIIEQSKNFVKRQFRTWNNSYLGRSSCSAPCPGLSRASTSVFAPSFARKDVDPRDTPGTARKGRSPGGGGNDSLRCFNLM